MKTTPKRSRPSRATALLLGAAAAGVAAAVAALSACVDPDSYVYTAQRYDPVTGCLAAYEAIEVVNGSGVSSVCNATCLTAFDALFVSTMCPPLPTIATAVEESAPDCVAARAAPACDAPPDDDAGGEAGADAALPDPDGSLSPDDAGESDAADAATPPRDASEAG